MCSEGVDLCKVAAIARSTSNSILAYVDNSLLEQTKSVALDIAKNTVQEEQVSQPAASSNDIHIGPALAKPYVKATRPRSNIHVKCLLQPGTTRCRLWNWSASRSFTELEQPIFFENEADDHMAELCSRCRETLTDSEEDAASSESSCAEAA